MCKRPGTKEIGLGDGIPEHRGGGKGLRRDGVLHLRGADVLRVEGDDG